MSKITAIVNQKGGVGKTTTALNLGYALSEEIIESHKKNLENSKLKYEKPFPYEEE